MSGLDKILSVKFIAILLFFVGCASTTQQQREEDSTGELDIPAEDVVEIELREQTYVNMYATGGDDWREPWQPDIAPPARFDLMAGREESREEVEEASLEQVQGFRIQLLDVLTQQDANAAYEAALAKFTHVYITFRSPNYKIRAGNYKSRLAAEQELPLARECGFRNAWLVPDWVFVNPPAPVETDSLATIDDLPDDVPAETIHPE
jgi:hypothetical protein